MEAGAQTKANERFARGKTAGRYSGSIRGERYMDSVLRAKGGQTFRTVLEIRRGAPVHFNVLPSGSAVAIADDARQATSWRSVVPDDGIYVVGDYMKKATDRTIGHRHTRFGSVSMLN